MPSKPPPPGKCVHCLHDFDELTWDHVLPKAWYPVGLTDDAKWKVPACKSCNHDLGKLEENLLIKLGLCLDPSDRTTLGIPDKVLRSLNPELGKSPRDSKHRLQKREKIIKSVTVYQDLPKVGIFPNFGPIAGLQYNGYPSLEITEQEVNQFGAKIARGIAYLVDGSFIEATYEIRVYIINDRAAAPIDDLLKTSATAFELPPAIHVERALVEQDKVGGIYYIEIWKRFKLYVIVAPKGLQELTTEQASHTP